MMHLDISFVSALSNNIPGAIKAFRMGLQVRKELSCYFAIVSLYTLGPHDKNLILDRLFLEKL